MTMNEEDHCWCGSMLKDKPHNCIGTRGRVEGLLDEKRRLLLQIDDLKKQRIEAGQCLSQAARDLADANRLNGELVEALQHMKMCGSCGEDSWNICDGGRQAQATLDKATTPEKRFCDDCNEPGNHMHLHGAYCSCKKCKG